MPSEAFLLLGHLWLLHADLIYSSVWSPNLRVFQVEPLFSRQLLYYAQQVGGHYYRNYEHTGVTEHVSPSEDYQRAITHHHSSSLQEWAQQEPETVEKLKKQWWPFRRENRTGNDGLTLMCTFLSVFLYLFRASSRFYDWICKENWQLGGLCCKAKCWMLGKCAHLPSRVWFGFTVYSEQKTESRQL